MTPPNDPLLSFHSEPAPRVFGTGPNDAAAATPGCASGLLKTDNVAGARDQFVNQPRPQCCECWIVDNAYRRLGEHGINREQTPSRITVPVRGSMRVDRARA